MTRLKSHILTIIAGISMIFTSCEHEGINSTNEYFYFRGHTFPVVTKMINGTKIRYALGLVAFTTNPKVTIDQLQTIVDRFEGEILDVWQPTDSEALDITMKIPFDLDPFSVAAELKLSHLIKHAEPVFISTPENGI